MRLIDAVQAAPWAIVPAKLDAIHQVLLSRLRGTTLPEASEYQSRLQRDKERGTSYTRIQNGVAVIEMEGILSKRMNMFMEFSGGTSTELLQRDLRVALADDNVRAILLDIDSPGGTVDGTEALASLVYASRGVKPVVAFGNGMMASAAYWIGSGADEIVVEETAEIGSIGVVMMHYDYSGADERCGVKRTVLRAGQYKAYGNDAEPLSEEAAEYFQGHLDYLYTLFVDAVARNRGADAEDVLSDMAEGRVFIGQQAVDAGLVDRLGNFETAMALAMDRAAGRQTTYITHGAEAPRIEEEIIMSKITLEVLKKEAPELLAQIQDEARAEGAASVDTTAQINEAVQAAVSDERTRVLGLTEAKFGADASKPVRRMAEQGVTVEQFQAMIEALGPAAPPKPAKPDKKTEILDALHQAGAEDPGPGGAPSGPATFMDAVRAIKLELGCTHAQAVKEAHKRHPDLHAALVGRQAEGE